MTSTQQQLAKELSSFAEAAPSVEDLMSIIVGRLQERLRHYDWVGFYMIEKPDEGAEPVLVLGPYVGAVTSHTRIPLNQGICGAAASSGKTVVVDDVNADPRYLACSIQTKSEIVVPIRVKGEVVGELDIDSHTPAAFQADDRQLVEHCASLVGMYLEKAAYGHPA
jgi:L-methionine (R)-S-oxide reductase